MKPETFDCQSIPCPDRGDVCGACQGHRVTKRIREVADIICWTQRVQHLDDLGRQHGKRFTLALLDDGLRS